MYIYDQPDWPQFVWDERRISELLPALHQKQGRLIGGMESIGFQLRDKAILHSLTQDIIKSSEIEGEILDPSSVRSSVARRLGIEIGGLEKQDRSVDGVVEMVLDATQRYDQPLTEERLFGWHAALFPTGWSGLSRITVGDWRPGQVDVVSGEFGNETVHFEAPSADRVRDEMATFLGWMNQNSDLDLILKSAIAHLWFVTIHPFADGNGRISRAIADLLLARSEKSPRRFYSLSSQIRRERRGYYTILEKTQKGEMDITPWLEWYFRCLHKAIDSALEQLERVLEKARQWEALAQIELNPRQRKIIDRLFDDFEGKLTTSKWAKMAKCSQDTAYRDILDLIERGILKKDPGKGRNTSYSLVEPESI